MAGRVFDRDQHRGLLRSGEQAGEFSGPTFEEAQKDFREIHSRFSAFRN